MKKLVWFIVAVLACVGLTQAAMYHFDRQYKNNTPSEVKKVHESFAAELKQLKRGDFIELNDGALMMVVDPYETFYIGVRRSPEHGVQNRRPNRLGRQVTRIIRTNDKDWPEMASKFLTE